MMEPCIGMWRPDYVPIEYAPVLIDGALLWVAGEGLAGGGNPEPVLAGLVEKALVGVGTLLRFRPRRPVHVVVYASARDARVALDRELPSTFLLAPLQQPEGSLISMHSARVDSRNGDAHHMLRHLCHEVAHVCAAEKSGSLKRLGDGNEGMRVASWVDEGVAEKVAAEVADRPDVIKRAFALDTKPRPPIEELDEILNDLNDTRREWAFAIATTIVWSGIQRCG